MSELDKRVWDQHRHTSMALQHTNSITEAWTNLADDGTHGNEMAAA